MKNETNIYDIDGNLIRAAGDNHEFTIDEVEKMVDDLTKKVQENPENKVYKVYLNNAQKWLFKMYNEMSKEDVMKRLTVLQSSVDAAKDAQNAENQAVLDKINEEMDKLKEAYLEEKPKTQEDMLVDREGEAPAMEEYVQFEEENERN